MGVNSSLKILTFLSGIPWGLNVLNKSSITWVRVIQTVAHNALYGIRPYQVVGNRTSYRLVHDTVMKKRDYGHGNSARLLPRAQMLKKSAWLRHLIGNKTPITRTLNRRCYPHTGNGGHSWCLSSSLSLSVGCCSLRTTGGSLPCGRN